MSEAKDYIKDKYERNKQAASDPNVPISEAAKQAWNEAASDWAAIGAYAQCRKQRKLDVSNRLKEVRKACGLRQQDVAEKTGINVKHGGAGQAGGCVPCDAGLPHVSDGQRGMT